jgi:hypothetical protein
MRCPRFLSSSRRDRKTLNYHDVLVQVADDCPVTAAQVPQARGGRKTKAVVEYELLAKHPYRYTEEDIAFEVYAILHHIPKAKRRTERTKLVSKGHPHLLAPREALRLGDPQQRPGQDRAGRD